MTGMNASLGAELGGFDHLKQSVQDILTTPKGSRVMLRDYGSDLFSLIDQPLTRETEMAIIAATIGALTTWEPRLQVDSVQVAGDPASGQIAISLQGTYLPDGQPISISGLKLQ
jgi:phage baseplate assembly protein W